MYIFRLHHILVMKGLQKTGTPNSNMFRLSFYIHMVRDNTFFKDSVSKISHCDVREAFACDLSRTQDDRLCEVHHCPVTL